MGGFTDTEYKMEPKRLRNILFILFFILILLFGAWYGYDWLQEKRRQQDDIEEIIERDAGIQEEQSALEPESEKTVEQPVQEAEPEETDEPAAEELSEDEKIHRYVTGDHTVKKGESFSLITGFYWDDIFLWPDLYIRNSMRSDDPDLIYPDEIITIYNRLGAGDKFTGQETENILEAYLQVYRVYKKLGERKNNSVWSLLWCAARYDHEFLDKYSDRIDPEDRAMAQKYIDEQGFLD